MTHITDERLLSIRKQYSYRAYGESRDENDDVANELADVASAITELLAARAEVARLQGRAVPLTEWQQMEAERDKLRAEVARLQSALATSFCDLRSDLLHMTQRCAEATDHVVTLTSALEEANVDREAMRANDARWRYSRICGWPNDSSISGDELDRITDEEIALTQEKQKWDAAIDAVLTQEKRGG